MSRAIPLALFLAACDTSKEPASNYPPCEYSDRALGWDEYQGDSSPEGLLAPFLEPFVARGQWRGGDVAQLSATILADRGEEPLLHELTFDANGDCATEVQIPVRVDLQTDDGALNENLPAIWTATPDLPSRPFAVKWWFDAEDLEGAWASRDLDDQVVNDEVRLWLEISDELALSGELRSRQTRLEGYVPSITEEAVLTWPAP